MSELEKLKLVNNDLMIEREHHLQKLESISSLYKHMENKLRKSESKLA